MADTSQWTQADYDAYAKRYAPAQPAAPAKPTAPQSGGTQPAAMTQQMGGTPPTAYSSSGDAQTQQMSAPGTTVTDPNMGPAPAAPAAPAAPPPNPRTNFKWGTAGVGVEGVDWGNTNNWDDATWRTYEQQHGLTSPGAAPAAPGAPAAPAAPSDSDIYRDALLKQMNEDKTPDVNDPEIQAQLQPLAAANERARREAVSRAAEESFGAAGGEQIGTPEKLAAAEAAGQQTGLQASDLVGRELQSRRTEIAQALQLFGDRLNAQDKNALEEKLAQLDAQIKREGISSQATLGAQDIGLRRELGTQQNNIDLLRTLLGNQQSNDRLGFDIGNAQAVLNNSALRSLFG